MDEETPKKPGLRFWLFLLGLTAATVGISSYGTYEAWQKAAQPPPSPEEYRQRLQSRLEELQALQEQAKQSTQVVAAALLKDARQALVKGDHAQAIRLANEVLQADAKHGGAYLVRGMAQYRSGHTPEALADLEKAIALEPGQAEAFVYRGLVKNRQKQQTEALADFSQAIRLNPKYGAAYYYRAELRQQGGQPELAQEDYRQACELGIKQSCEKIK